MRVRSKRDQNELLSGLGFTPYKALKIVLFSMTFSALGFGVFVFSADHAMRGLSYECSGALKKTFDNISSIYAPSAYHNDLVEVRAYPESKKVKKVGPDDLNLANRSSLISVKMQKKKITDNLYILRTVNK
ncbi:MAG: hypothetical protein ACI4UM_08925 [Succinivibrio sp.]